MLTQTSAPANTCSIHSIANQKESCQCRKHNDFTEVKVLLDLSFQERALIRCNKCKKHYIREFVMSWDYESGFDWTDTYFIPVPNNFGILETIKAIDAKKVYEAAV